MKIAEIKDITDLLPDSFKECLNLLENSTTKGHFTAWSVGNSHFLISCCHPDENHAPELFSNQAKTSQKSMHPHFDLASLTKPCFFNTWLRLKWEEDFHGFLSQNLDRFPWIKKGWNEELLDFIQKNQDLTFDTFLSHKSKLHPWFWCGFCLEDQKTDLVREGLVTRLIGAFDSANVPVYSDLNYMFLALLAESLFDVKNWSDEINHLNKALNTHFFHASIHPEKSQFAIPSYPYKLVTPGMENCENEKTFGFVHDTNANLFASLQDENRIVSGHAGLFGNIADVLQCAQFLKRTQPFVNFETLKDRFVYGLDHKEKNFGHLGYTGTSFWFKSTKSHDQPQDDVILLTNRTARRKKIMKTTTPRACIVTNLEKDEHHYFWIADECFETLSQEQFLIRSLEHFSNAKKFWDDSALFEYQNLSELRNAIEKQIW